MKLRSDYRAAIMMKNRLHHESGESIDVNFIPPDTAIHEQMTTTNGYDKECTITSTLPTSTRPLWTTT